MTTIIIVSVIIILVFLYLRSQYKKIKNMPLVESNERIKVLTDKNFQSITAKGVTLVDFWAPWCGPCKMIAPVLNEISNEIENKALIAKMNVDENSLIPNKFGIRSIPTLIVFKNGKEVSRLVGMKNKKNILDEIYKFV